MIAFHNFDFIFKILNFLISSNYPLKAACLRFTAGCCAQGRAVWGRNSEENCRRLWIMQAYVSQWDARTLINWPIRGQGWWSTCDTEQCPGHISVCCLGNRFLSWLSGNSPIGKDNKFFSYVKSEFSLLLIWWCFKDLWLVEHYQSVFHVSC